MAKGIYVGVGNVAKKVKSAYIGVDGVARKIKKAYIGVGGVAKEIYSAEVTESITKKNVTGGQFFFGTVYKNKFIKFNLKGKLFPNAGIETVFVEFDKDFTEYITNDYIYININEEKYANLYISSGFSASKYMVAVSQENPSGVAYRLEITCTLTYTS